MTMKTMYDRQVEVRDWTVRKGWRGGDAPERTFGDDMSLLHSEVSEAIEAFRVNGMKAWVDAVIDGVDRLTVWNQEYNSRKPEGVGSELADVLIRLLDNYAERGYEAEDGVIEWADEGRYESFGDAMAQLHRKISHAYGAQRMYRFADQHEQNEIILDEFNGILIELQIICHVFEVDLFGEYEAKMKYNETRSHRHGDKLL